MIYIVGDTHFDYDFTSLLMLAKKYPNLTKKDYVIVAGDCGVCYKKEYLEEARRYMDYLPFTLLFVDGNHENFDILNSYEKEEWHGGLVHKLYDDVIHLTRGQIFVIDDITFLTIGGAESTDKWMRVEGDSWWPEESVTYDDIETSLFNLAKYQNSVDYIITHTVPQSFLYSYPFYPKNLGKANTSELFLERIKEVATYKTWFFGHWHTDYKIGFGGMAIYHNIYEVTKDEVELVIDSEKITDSVLVEINRLKKEIRNK